MEHASSFDKSYQASKRNQLLLFLKISIVTVMVWDDLAVTQVKKLYSLILITKRLEDRSNNLIIAGEIKLSEIVRLKFKKLIVFLKNLDGVFGVLNQLRQLNTF